MDNIWYESLKKPLFTPPSEIFLPAWIFLYLLIFAAILVYIFSRSDKNKTPGYVFFGLQLFFNLIWSPVFFGMKNIGWSLVIISLLIVFSTFTIYKFYKISKISAALLVPYFIWSCFAAYLNFGIFYLNRI